MKLVTVTPLDRAIFKEQLTYFSSLPIKLGALVSVPVRNRQVTALVIKLEEAGEARALVRQADFALKKIGEVKAEALFLSPFLRAVERTANFYAAPLGLVLRQLVPQAIVASLGTQAKKVALAPENIEAPSPQKTIKQHKFILQEDDEERVATYKSLIRESFAKKNSVFLCLPTIADIERVSKSFDAGIADFTICLHSGLSPKLQLAGWNRALSEKHPLLIIATPLFLSLPRTDIKTIILDRENASSYKGNQRPFIDYRRFAEFLAEESDSRLIIGDLVIRSETILRTERGELVTLSANKYRSVSSAEQIIIDNKQHAAKSDSGQALADATRALITDAIERRRKVLIFSGRAGLAPNTVCSDCGTIISCARCHSPLVLHRRRPEDAHAGEAAYFYLCHKCGQTANVEDRCPYCAGWRLALLGFGIDKVDEELGELFPTIPRFRYDKNTVKTAARGRALLDRFTSTKGAAILCATETVLNSLAEPIDTVAVVALDSLFALPDFRISEKIFNTVLKLRHYAHDRFIIQTRNAEEKVFTYAKEGNLIDFYRDEIAERLQYGYPPFKTMITITRVGPAGKIQPEMDELEKKMADWELTVFPVGDPDNERGYRLTALLRLPAGLWPEKKLGLILRSLPPDFIVNIEPDSIL